MRTRALCLEHATEADVGVRFFLRRFLLLLLLLLGAAGGGGIATSRRGTSAAAAGGGDQVRHVAILEQGDCTAQANTVTDHAQAKGNGTDRT